MRFPHRRSDPDENRFNGERAKVIAAEFDLDQFTFYSNYVGDASGKVKLDAERQQIESLQSEIDRLAKKDYAR